MCVCVTPQTDEPNDPKGQPARSAVLAGPRGPYEQRTHSKSTVHVDKALFLKAIPSIAWRYFHY